MRWLVGAGLALILCASGMAQTKEELVGTWKLVSATDTADKGEVQNAFGHGPVGFLTYTVDGRMMAIVSNGGRQPLSIPDYIAAPAEERAKAFATFSAYAGTYTLESHRVIHHVQVSSLQNRVGTDLVRTIVSLKDGRLILETPPFLKGGKTVTTKLTWERITNGTAKN